MCTFTRLRQKLPQLQTFRHQLFVKLVNSLLLLAHGLLGFHLERPAYAHTVYARREYVTFHQVQSIPAGNTYVLPIERNALPDAIC
ncbi:hypothetical protein HY418_01960 [Candidatus Kaiserbacteria bacterium]|nr:hypothetical protein [Candidatus Kaiserbacteria bacterium]